MNEKKEIESRRFEEDDVYDIENPAYVVKRINKKDADVVKRINKKDADMDKGKYRGCIVSWNKKFEDLTNLEPQDIDNSYCHKLFDGCQRQESKKYIKVCRPNCTHYKGETQEAVILRDIWIKSKEDSRRNVDIYIFPFVSKCNECSQVLDHFALHLLIARNDSENVPNVLDNIIDNKEEIKPSKVEMEDVKKIRNPAFIVKQADGGDIAFGNDAFWNLTKFNKSDIKKCNILFEGYQWQGGSNYVPVCKFDCEFRTGKTKEATVLRNIWIKSKKNGNDIRQKVDICILPFVSNDSNYALHILIDKKGKHDNKHFEIHMCKKEKCETI